MKWLIAIGFVLLLSVQASAQVWTEHLVDGEFYGVNNVYAADMDGDGDMDVLGSAQVDDEITWWENVDGDGLNWSEHVVDGQCDYACSVYAADVDGDGDMDVLGVAFSTSDVTWWENLGGTGLYWSEHTIDDDFEGADQVSAKDLDGDGDLDVLGTAGGWYPNNITWWENVDGSGLSWSEHVVDESFPDAEDVCAEDMDGDGDMDVLGASWEDDDITWWENMDGTGLTWTEHTVDGEFDGAQSVYAEDVDGDGDMDVLGAAYFAMEITWWENVDGSGLNWTEHNVDLVVGPWSVFAEDVDGDGDTDIFGVGGNWHVISWWENVDGTGLNWTEHILDDQCGSVVDIFAADVDGDGDLDVVGAEAGIESVCWWEQPGSQDPVVVTLTPTSPVDLPAAGGTLEYDVQIVSNLPNSYPGVVFWTKVKLPNGSFYPVIQFQVSFTLQPYMDVSGNLAQDIPGFAPAGSYEMWGWIGYNPNGGPSFGDNFHFMKSAAVAARTHVNRWAACGSLIADDEAFREELPAYRDLILIYPNPFNSSTTVSVTLPGTMDLMIVVYNITGQQVAELSSGRHEAGIHSFVFDASGLASGLYFIHALVPGHLDQVRKVMLVR